ncbi:hypothetical protein B0A81_15820 [Flavobacterium plurextorum]|uniref:Type II toxin-antitoxin system HicB family antitoxin n=2 Tax=Flavobacteriaceae TaxID=49546 RepID=A0ABX4CRW5_9FLAO|nr:hypothetical protein B0A81_15820 [Flavobacterium plurextorum]OXB24147.1 hypothetical protein B0A80_05450 [Flavobacterium tructae]
MKTSFMKTKAFIEIGNDGTYSVYIENSTLNYGIHGTGKTVKEAVEDFLNSYQEMKDFYNEKGKEFIETTFEFQFDVASFLKYMEIFHAESDILEDDELGLLIKDFESKDYLTVERVLKALNVNLVENDNILDNIKTGLEEMKFFKNGNLKTTPAKDFLNEL